MTYHNGIYIPSNLAVSFQSNKKKNPLKMGPYEINLHLYFSLYRSEVKPELEKIDCPSKDSP